MSILRSIKNTLPLLLLVLFVVVIAVIWLSKPTAKRRVDAPEAQISIEVLSVDARDISIQLTSYGLVEPRISTHLISQVSGKVDFVDEAFRDGGFFKKGQLLVSIEKSDYQIALENANANLADAQSTYQSELALAKQAKHDWKISGGRGEPPALVLRKPQLFAAEAKLKSAAAGYKLAQLNLNRTDINAPYDGRALRKNVDVGQVININTDLGEIYATDAVEIRLPIKNHELALIDLPEQYGDEESGTSKLPTVRIFSDLAGGESWEGTIVRTSSAINEESRQLSVVALIENPYGKARATGKFPLKILQYVTAEIEGKTLKQVIAIPNTAIYQGSYVYLFSENLVQRRDIKILWQNSETAIIDSGLVLGDQLIVTPLGRVASGTPVKLSGETTDNQISKEQKKDKPKKSS